MLECFLKHGIWVEITLFGGIEVEGYLRKASAEELKDYKRYYLAFEECEKYYYVTYKKSGKPDKELYFDERSVLSITWAGKPFEKIIDGEKKMGYRDCPCLKCDHGGEREKRIECRRKCTEFVAWKLSMQAVRQKKKEDKNKFYSETKLKCYRRKAMKQKTGRKR